MKIKNQDSGHNWQSRVRVYENISGTTYNEEEAWKKIRERLDQPPGRKTRSFYWLAAASVVLFFLSILFIPVSRKTVKPGLTKTPAGVKQNNVPVPVETIQAITNTAVKPSIPDIKTTAHTPINSLQPVHAKKESVAPLPVNNVFSLASDTAVVGGNIAKHPTPLPSVHFNDINAEPVPENITLKNLSVKKMIRLFSIDFTKEQPPKKQEAITPNQYTIPNNQN